MSNETGPLALGVRLWLEDRRIKPVIWDQHGQDFYLLGSQTEDGVNYYYYESRNKSQTIALTLNEIVSLSEQR